MKKPIAILFLAAALLSAAGCNEKEDYGTGKRPTAPNYIPKDGMFQIRGFNDPLAGDGDETRYPHFTYTDYLPLKDKPVEVFYYIPESGDVTTMPVLFSMTGAERTGNTQLNSWKYLADYYGFVVINPQFSKKYYTENEYQFGGVTDAKGSSTIVSQELWTYNIIESLFDYWCKETDSDQTGYRIFGHSAGGQFVSRMFMAMPQARIIRAVAANPSSWPWPVAEGLADADGNVYGWPYSIKGIPSADPQVLSGILARRLYIQVGVEDTGTESLDMSAAANAQGVRRHDRGVNFHQACLDVAGTLGVTCDFRLAEVQEVGHSTTHMVYGKRKPTAANVKEEQLGENSAFLLLFR